MKLDLSNSFDRNKFTARFKSLMEKRKKIELKEFRQTRTNQQNRYFHVACGILADHTGYTMDEMKALVKEEIDNQIGEYFMTYEKNGHRFYRSTADLSKTDFIRLTEFLIAYGSLLDCEIMTPEVFYEKQFDIERQLNGVL